MIQEVCRFLADFQAQVVSSFRRVLDDGVGVLGSNDDFRRFFTDFLANLVDTCLQEVSRVRFFRRMDAFFLDFFA